MAAVTRREGVETVTKDSVNSRVVFGLAQHRTSTCHYDSEDEEDGEALLLAARGFCPREQTPVLFEGSSMEPFLRASLFPWVPPFLVFPTFRQGQQRAAGFPFPKLPRYPEIRWQVGRWRWWW